MQQNNKFEFIEFDPRNGVEEYFNNSLIHFLDNIDDLVHCQALVWRKPNGFYFSVVIRTEFSLYNSDRLVPYEICTGMNRGWQTTVIAEILQDVYSQVKSWKKAKAQSPKTISKNKKDSESEQQ